MIAELKEILDYNPETGIFTWKIGKRLGAIAGTPNNSGYRQITIKYQIYAEHRLAWLYIHGEFPPDQIDHINRNRSDNRIANLRLASNGQNRINSKRPRNNSSGYKGVTWVPATKKWEASIGVNKKLHHLGRFTSLEEAATAYKNAAQKFYGKFATGESE